MKNPFHFWSFIRDLRAQGYLLALPLSSHVPSFTSYMLARLCGAKIVWAYDTTPFYGEAAWSRHLADVEVANRPANDPEWVKFMELARPLIGTSLPDDFTPEFDFKPEVESWAAGEWEKLKLPTGPKKVGLFFGGNPDRPERLWPAAYWGDLAVKLQKNPEVDACGDRAAAGFTFGKPGAGARRLSADCRASEPSARHFFRQRSFARRSVSQGARSFRLRGRRTLSHCRRRQSPDAGTFFKTDPACWKPPVAWTIVLRPADDRPTSLSPEEVYQQICEMVLKSKVIPSV